MVAAVVALAAHSACSQEVTHVESPLVESGTFVGDLSCNHCGASVENDQGLLQGKCPNCGGGLGSGCANGACSHGHGVGGGLSCSGCGASVENDHGLLQGKCPNCGGALSCEGGNGKGLGEKLFGPGGALRCSQCGVIDGDMYPRTYGQPDLFYNYYTQGLANRANAQMYLCPHPIPPNVGHTFYTYQPFYPHHYMYPHIDKYHRYYDMGRGMNRTRATYWRSACSKATNFYWNYLRLPR
jgi:DNA-directed RNA polymerase subunit RPC12/RpoP